MKKSHVFILSAVLLLLAFVGGALVYKNRQAEQAARALEQYRQALNREHSPALGKPDARVHIVEFFDPACETCRAFYPLVKNMMAANPDRIRLSLRYAPFHTGSDQVVKILEAARKQGKFWPALEAVFASQPEWAPHHAPQPDQVWKYLGGLGLDLEQMRKDMNAPEIASIVARDLADAKALNVTATPEYFVNGRPLASFGYEQLKDLVQDELAMSYR
jgi:protein-disulfide isomerase